MQWFWALNYWSIITDKSCCRLLQAHFRSPSQVNSWPVSSSSRDRLNFTVNEPKSSIQILFFKLESIFKFARLNALVWQKNGSFWVNWGKRNEVRHRPEWAYKVASEPESEGSIRRGAANPGSSSSKGIFTSLPVWGKSSPFGLELASSTVWTAMVSLSQDKTATVWLSLHLSLLQRWSGSKVVGQATTKARRQRREAEALFSLNDALRSAAVTSVVHRSLSRAHVSLLLLHFVNRTLPTTEPSPLSTLFSFSRLNPSLTRQQQTNFFVEPLAMLMCHCFLYVNPPCCFSTCLSGPVFNLNFYWTSSSSTNTSTCVTLFFLNRSCTKVCVNPWTISFSHQLVHLCTIFVTQQPPLF